MAREVVVLCIGSDKISGDSLGPLVGSYLREEFKLPYPVYGTEGYSVNGVNLDSYADMVRCRHKQSTVIAVDAAIGTKKDVGKVRLRRGGIKAGGALGSKRGYIGDIGIMGVVAEEGDNVMGSLLSVPFEKVRHLAEQISALIACALLRT